MLPYIITFLISLLAVNLVDVYYDELIVRRIGSLFAVLPPILLAGFRDSTVGSDMELYIIPIFETVSSMELSLSAIADKYEDIELLYLFLNYIVSMITNYSFVFLIVIHLLIILPMYLSAMKLRLSLSPVMFMFIYYMIFYQESLSIVRQSIAISLFIYAITAWLDKQYLKYFLITLLAIGFHRTAILTLTIPSIYYLIYRYPINIYKKQYLITLIIFGSVFLNFENIILWLINSGIINLKYLIYTSVDGTFTPVVGSTNLMVKIVILLYFLYVMKEYVIDDLAILFFVLNIIDLVFSLCALIVQPLDRLSLYFRLIACMSIPYYIINYPISVQRFKIPVKLLFCVVLAFYWYYVYILGNYDDTSDYQLNSNLFG